jgi:predicted membrane protein
MKLHDEVLEKFGDLLIDLGKAAMVAGAAALFFEKFRFFTTVGGILLGLIFISAGLYSFHELGRRHKKAASTDQ